MFDCVPIVVMPVKKENKKVKKKKKNTGHP